MAVMEMCYPSDIKSVSFTVRYEPDLLMCRHRTSALACQILASAPSVTESGPERGAGSETGSLSGPLAHLLPDGTW